MRYSYAYKTSDGRRHEATIEATSREVAFAALRAQGIKPIKVIAADGSKANGEIVVKGVRRRVVTVGALCLVLCALCGIVVAFWLGRGRSPSAPHGDESGGRGATALPLTTPRHQVYGDPAIIQEIESGAIVVARTEVEKFLLAYAIPGRYVTAPKCPAKVEIGDLVLTPIDPADPSEVTAYRQILNGLKSEAKAYLEGGGTWQAYVTELKARQKEEIEIYERTRRELENVTDRKIRDERNAALRAMGLRTIPRPSPH